MLFSCVCVCVCVCVCSFVQLTFVLDTRVEERGSFLFLLHMRDSPAVLISVDKIHDKGGNSLLYGGAKKSLERL